MSCSLSCGKPIYVCMFPKLVMIKGKINMVGESNDWISEVSTPRRKPPPDFFFCDVNPSVDNAKFKPLKKRWRFSKGQNELRISEAFNKSREKKKVT